MDTVSRQSDSPEQTEAAGRLLGAALARGDLVCLTGDLGAGKTVFVRGLCTGIGSDQEKVRSPTFVLAHRYDGGRIPLLHVDCYRLGPGADLEVIDLHDALQEGAVAVEWGEYSDQVSRADTVVSIELTGDNSRRLHLETSVDRLYEAWMR